jgi:hypothetical protein
MGCKVFCNLGFFLTRNHSGIDINRLAFTLQPESRHSVIR